MTNFTDFLTVAKEAQKNVELMREKTQIINTEIAEIQNSKYKTFCHFWHDVSDVLRELKMTNTQWVFKVPITFGDKSVYMKIYIDYKATVQLGIFVGSKADFRRWVALIDNYNKFTYETGKDPVVQAIVCELIDDWNQWAPKFEVAIKEFITEYMARKLENAQDEYSKACTKLTNI